MVVDAMLKSTEDRAASAIYKKILGPEAAAALEGLLGPLAEVGSWRGCGAGFPPALLLAEPSPRAGACGPSGIAGVGSRWRAT